MPRIIPKNIQNDYTRIVYASAFVLPDETSDFADDFAALKGTDGYAVRERNGRIVFIADCPKGHVNGVHRWLEKNSDIICLFNGREAIVEEIASSERLRGFLAGKFAAYLVRPEFEDAVEGFVQTEDDPDQRKRLVLGRMRAVADLMTISV